MVEGARVEIVYTAKPYRGFKSLSLSAPMRRKIRYVVILYGSETKKEKFMTIPLYLNDTYRFTAEASVVFLGEDEKGCFILLDQTPFYPQGGGQPSDQGWIHNPDFSAEVSLVRQYEHDIRHYILPPEGKIEIGTSVTCDVNEKRRLLNARYHTAGHLLGNVLETLYPSLKTIKGHSFPNEAFLELQGEGQVDLALIQQALDEAILSNAKTTLFEMDPFSFEEIYYALPYPVPAHKAFRAMRIGTFLPVPCGGTHVSSLQELGQVTLGKLKYKSEKLKTLSDVIHIRYQLKA